MVSGSESYLLFLYADGCPASAAMISVVRDVQREYGERLPCITLNIKSPLARKYQSSISAVPALLLMRGNDEVWRGTGLLHTSEILTHIDELS